MNSRIRLLLVAAVLIPALLIWEFGLPEAEQVPQRPHVAGSSAAPAAKSDFFMRDASITQLSNDGSRARLTSERLDHYPDSQLMIGQNPILIREDGSQAPLKITAREGYWPDNNSRVNLSGDVRLQDKGTASAPGQRLLMTEQLSYFPQTNTAETERRVKLYQGRQTLSGTGLDADLDARIYTLHADVQGTYHAN